MTDINIGSIAAMPIIVALIELAKALGLPTKYAPWLNAVLACLAYGVGLLVQAHPDWETAVTIALNMIITFLGAAGLYDIGKNIVKSASA